MLKTDKNNFEDPSITNDSRTQLNSFGQFGKSINNVETSIKVGESKKFYFTVYAPSKSSGAYRGKLLVKNKGRVIDGLELNVNVPNYSLKKLSDKFPLGCFVNDRIYTTQPPEGFTQKHFFVDESLFRARLSHAEKIGCTSLILRYGNHTDIAKMISVANEIGFRGNIFLNYYYLSDDWKDYAVAWEKDSKFANHLTFTSEQSKSFLRSQLDLLLAQFGDSGQKISTPISFYGLDEPNTSPSKDTDKFIAHGEAVKNIKEVLRGFFRCEGPSCNYRIFKNDVTTAANFFTTSRINDSEIRTDFPISNIRSNGNAGDIVSRIKDLNNDASTWGTEGYYFQAWNERPYVNRYLTGFGFASTMMKARYINPLWGYFNAKSSPIFTEDMDRPVKYTQEGNTYMKQMMTMYPASNGLVKTLQSEGTREGVVDLKYLQNYLGIKRNAKMSEARKKLSNQIDKEIEKFSFMKNIQNNPDYFNYEVSVKPSDFEGLRSLIKDFISTK